MQPERSGANVSRGTPVSRFRRVRARVAGRSSSPPWRALAKILHEWEAANVRGTELEPYWEPTPFPLEQ
jgi:hypothetical protein